MTANFNAVSQTVPDAPTLTVTSYDSSSIGLRITPNGEAQEGYTTSCEIPEPAESVSGAIVGPSQSTESYDLIVSGTARDDGYIVASGQANLKAFASLDQARAVSQIRLAVPGGDEQHYRLAEARLGHQEHRFG